MAKSIIEWRKVTREDVPPCRNILFTDGKKIYAGWLETVYEEEDLVFFDCLERETVYEGVTHWYDLKELNKTEK